MSNGSPRLVIRLPGGDKDALEAMAERQGTTMSEIARPAVLAALRELIDGEAKVHDTPPLPVSRMGGKPSLKVKK